MELKGKDGYKIEIHHEISESQIYSLMVCYQPLIGSTAVSLYLTLAQEGKGQRGYDTHQRLCALMGIDIVAFEMARQKCEEVNLIASWQENNENRDNYIYVLYPALESEGFLRHDVFGRRYMQLVGARNAEITQSKSISPQLSKEGFVNVSKRFDSAALAGWDRDDEVKFTRIKPLYSYKNNQKKHIDFDYDTFLAESTNLSFPIEARTSEALEVIGELATIYGISAERMRILVGHSINNSNNVLNISKLKRLASYEKPAEKKAKNEYDVAPAQFLSSRQNGIPVTPADGKLLEYLVSEMKLNQEVVNVLIEMVLEHNENRLNRSYVEKIASTWVRNGVDNLEKAKKAASEDISVKKRQPAQRKAVLPKNFVKESGSGGNTTNEKKLSEEELEALRERLKRLEG